MKSEELFEDLKQFITATVSQQATGLEKRLDAIEQRMATKEDLADVEQRMATKEDIQELRADMDGQFNTVLDAIGERFETTDARVQNVEDQLQRLEKRAA